jgi:hypothetical protein
MRDKTISRIPIEAAYRDTLEAKVVAERSLGDRGLPGHRPAYRHPVALEAARDRARQTAEQMT